MIGKIILGLIIVAIGALVTIKAEWIFQNLGGIPTAEKYLGTEGGSRLAYKLIGIITAIVGFLVMTDMMGKIIWAIFGSLFGGLTK